MVALKEYPATLGGDREGAAAPDALLLADCICGAYTMLMQTPGDPLDGRSGFDWDAANATKIWERHRVTPSEAEEVFSGRVVSARPMNRKELTTYAEAATEAP